MKTNRISLRTLALVLSFAMVFGAMPATMFAQGGGAACTHVHGADCGYAEGVPCEHEHDAACAYNEGKDSVSCDLGLEANEEGNEDGGDVPFGLDPDDNEEGNEDGGDVPFGLDLDDNEEGNEDGGDDHCDPSLDGNEECNEASPGDSSETVALVSALADLTAQNSTGILTSAAAELTNVALASKGGSVISTTSTGGKPTFLLIDGKIELRSQATDQPYLWDDFDGNHYSNNDYPDLEIILEFNDVYNIEEIRIAHFADTGVPPASISVEYYNGSSYVFVKKITSGIIVHNWGALTDYNTFIPLDAAVKTNRIKLIFEHQAEGRTTGQAVGMSEIGVFTSDEWKGVLPQSELTNIALASKGTILRTTSTKGLDDGLLNDGDISGYWDDWDGTYWLDPAGYPDLVVDIEFDAEYTVEEIRMVLSTDYGSAKGPASIEAQYYDGVGYVSAKTVLRSDIVLEALPIMDYNNTIQLDPAVKTSKIKLIFKHFHEPGPWNNAVGMTEIGVFSRVTNVALMSNGGRAAASATNKNAPKSTDKLINDLISPYGYYSSYRGTNEEIYDDFNLEYYTGGDYPDDLKVAVQFNKEYKIEDIKLALYDDGGGIMKPASITVLYLDGDDYVEVKKITSGISAGDEITLTDFNNIITFDSPIKTKTIQLIFEHTKTAPEGRAVGITEIGAFTAEDWEDATQPEPVGADIQIPPEPTGVDGVSTPIIDLNGQWEFAFAPSSKPPSPFFEDDKQDYDFTTWNSSVWEPVIVPGELVMQGFDIVYDNEYYYRKLLSIPNDYTGKRIILRFYAVYGEARVWVDGKFVRSHKGSFNTWDCDITDYVNAGSAATMIIGVTDRKEDASGASAYAIHRIGGVNRDVALMALPKDYIMRVFTETVFTDKSFTDANLKIQAQLGMIESADAVIRFDLIGMNGSIASTMTQNFSRTTGDASDLVNISLPVANPQKWDAEHPNLYTLKTTLTVNGVTKEITEQKIGLRQIDFGGSNGTETNKVYVNGKEVKLRGVNRHDVSYTMGRSTAKEQDYAEIKAYKEANVNFIRTSHYAVSKHLLDACDEFGIYVEEENGACWGPTGTTEENLNQVKEMLIRDRNHPSIIMWSIANEATWADQFRECYKYIKKEDPTRLVIFSYPTTVPAGENVVFDIYSYHYLSWNSTYLGTSVPDGQPVLIDEYAPSACHHYYEIQKDLSARAFYEQTIYKFWDNILVTDGALGGAIWAAGDDIFFIPDGTTKDTRGVQGHYDGKTAGLALWGVIHDAYKREKPEAWLVKKGYSPTRLAEKEFSNNEGALKIPVRNAFDHTDFSEVSIEYSIDGGVIKTVASPSIAPHGSGSLTIADPGLDGAKNVNIKFFTEFGGNKLLIDEYNIALMITTYSFTPASPAAPAVNDAGGLITVSGENFSIVFDKAKGLIREASYGTKTLINGGPYLHATDMDFGVAGLDNEWIPAAAGGVFVAIDGNLAVVTLKGAYARGQGVEFTVKISGNGIITTDYVLTTVPEIRYTGDTGAMREVGVSYDIPSDIESVDWDHIAFHSAYPENNIARKKGKAPKVRAGYKDNPDKYGVLPIWDWYMDMADFSLFVTDDPRDGIVTNDFKTMRDNIWYYNVNYVGTDAKISVESDTSEAARVEVAPGWTLVDDRDASIVYSGIWTERERKVSPVNDTSTRNLAYNLTETVTGMAGAYAELTFAGVGVSFISSRQDANGWLKVYVDGVFKKRVDSFAWMSQSNRRVLYSISGLSNGAHTIRIECEGAGELAVDAFGVMTVAPDDAAGQKSRLIINDKWYYPDLAWGSYNGTPGSIVNGARGSVTIRLSDTDNAIPVLISPIAVEDISVVSSITSPGESLTLNGTILPANAAVQSINWSVKDQGATGAEISGSVFKASSPGVAIVTATAGVYAKDFVVVVRNNAALAGQMYITDETYEEPGKSVNCLNDGILMYDGSSSTLWADWRGDYIYPEHATIGVTWNTARMIDAFSLYILHDGYGVVIPSRITLQYWDDVTQAYVNVQNQSRDRYFTGNSFANLGNLITFTPVTTTDFRAVIEHGADAAGDIRGLGFSEFIVYEVDVYKVQFSVIDAGAASGSGISATYNGSSIVNGDVVIGGKTLTISANGAGASSYTYAWSGVGTNGETVSQISIDKLYGDVNAVCVVTGMNDGGGGSEFEHAVPTASVKKVDGNQNMLTITVTEYDENGLPENDVVGAFMIYNNSAGTHQVDKYLVYVDTKGNDQIRECKIMAVADPDNPMVIPTARVSKLSGNQNELYITVTIINPDSSVEAFDSGAIKIANNGSGTFTVSAYKVYVETKGSDKIEKCYIVE
ncbi:MAG: hypothetical protein FWH55_03945 [Oscillospiraceae bacterium]|nr:hypothetical protein [Oscillospiraceae bacterium]